MAAGYRYEDLRDLPTLANVEGGELKIDEPQLRVWVQVEERDPDDGVSYDEGVITVEYRVEDGGLGRWDKEEAVFYLYDDGHTEMEGEF